MDQVINIIVKNKIAETDFREELVSFNSVYRLKFSFDGEWTEYTSRVAVVVWAGGAAERLFEGNECEMPAVWSPHTENVLVGVYSSAGEKRIASSFVRLRCRAGAECVPSQTPVDSLHEQILSFLNGKDWSIFEEKIASGIYSAVRVNPFGLVTEGFRIVEVGKEGQRVPSADLARGGIFFRREEDGTFTLCHKGDDGALEELATAGAGGGELKHALTVGQKRFDGSADVSVSASDLGLARVATSGSYNDLSDKPDLSASGVTSVNGKEGAVTITASDLGLARVATSGNYNDLLNKPDLTEGPVLSVNGKEGAVVITASDLGLARVATSGNYEDLLNKPDLTEGAVLSVNGKEGAVVITASDLGLARVATTGSYNDLSDKPDLSAAGVSSVNGKSGKVTITASDLGLSKLATTGSFSDLKNVPELSKVMSVNGKTGAVTIAAEDFGFHEVASTGDYNDLINLPDLSGYVTGVNGKHGDLTITASDLGLSRVATSGSYNDLSDKPDLSAAGVTSVNGKSGAVTITLSDLGIGKVTNHRQMPLNDRALQGADFNDLTSVGVYQVEGTSSSPCKNAPISPENLASTSCQWGLIVIPKGDGSAVVQAAFSHKTDCSVRIRVYTASKWTDWKSLN